MHNLKLNDMEKRSLWMLTAVVLVALVASKSNAKERAEVTNLPRVETPGNVKTVPEGSISSWYQRGMPSLPSPQMSRTCRVN